MMVPTRCPPAVLCGFRSNPISEHHIPCPARNGMTPTRNGRVRFYQAPPSQNSCWFFLPLTYILLMERNSCFSLDFPFESG